MTVKKLFSYCIFFFLVISIGIFIFQYKNKFDFPLVDLNKENTSISDLPISRFYIIPNTSLLFAKFVKAPGIESEFGYSGPPPQRFMMIDLEKQERFIDYYLPPDIDRKIGFYRTKEFLIDNQPLIQCQFVIQPGGLIHSFSEFFPKPIENMIKPQHTWHFFDLTSKKVIKSQQSGLHLHSLFALDGKYPIASKDIHTPENIVSQYQLLEYKNSRWKPTHTFNEQNVYHPIKAKSHGYTKNSLIMQKADGLIIHSRENLETKMFVSYKQNEEYFPISSSDIPRRRLVSSNIAYLNDGWNFGQSNLLYELWLDWILGGKVKYTLLEVNQNAANNQKVEKIFQPVLKMEKLAPFTALRQDCILLLAEINKESSNQLILPGLSPILALTRKPGEQFNTEPIEIDIPDDAFVSKFPINDESLLLYRDHSFWSMDIESGEMQKLYSMN
jgi:hypothetical protein